MAAQIGNLQIRLGADIGDLQSRMRAARTEVANAASVMNTSLGRLDKGFQNTSKSAEASASAFIAGRKAANDLLASVDPLFAAQQRYNAKLDEATALLKNGSLTAAEFARVQQGLNGQLNGTNQVYGALTHGVGNARIAQMELQHVVTASIDAYAAGASPLRIMTLEMGRVAQAATFMGGGTAGGALGKVASFLGGPWGIAVVLGVSVLAQLIAKHKEHADSLNNSFNSLEKNKEQTALSAQAEDIWSHSIDGLIEREDKLNKSLTERLKTQTDLNRETLRGAQNDFAAATAAAAKLEADPKTPQDQLDKAEKAITKASINLHNATVQAGQDAGAAMTSITEAAKVAEDQIQHAIQIIQTAHPELGEKGPAAQLSASFNILKQSIDEAAGANVNFNDAIQRTNELNQELLNGTITVSDYQKGIAALAESLHQLTEQAKNPIVVTLNVKKNVADFKSAVFGAEGLGNNPLSSASGYGQFLAQKPGAPLTEWQTYFRQLFADQAKTMTAAQIDALRSNKGVATAIIDKATDDYIKTLKRAGQLVTTANLYTVHVLGAPDAAKFFAASPGQSVLSALGGGKHAQSVVANNGKLFSGTVADARKQLAQRIGDSSGAVSSGATAVQQALDEMQKQELTQLDNYTKQSAQLDAEIIRARTQQLAGYDSQAKASIDEAEADKKASYAAIQKQLDAGQITEAQAGVLRWQTDELTATREATIQRTEYLDNLRQIGEIQKQQTDQAMSDLQFADSIATTASEHRKIQLERLDIEYQQKKADLERLLLTIQSNKDFATSIDLQRQAMQVQGQIARLPIERAQAQSTIAHNTQGPYEQWYNSLPNTAAKVNEAFQTLEVQGFNGLIDAALALSDGFGSAKKALLSTLRDFLLGIARMQLQRTFASILPAGGFKIPGFATGGSFEIAGLPGIDRNTLSLNGLPIARVSHGERVNIDARNDNTPSMRSGPMGGWNGDMYVITPNADSFRRSEGQVTRGLKRRIR